jgi:erythromycin esterase-like protein
MQHKSALEAFRDGVFGVWSKSVECIELAQYLEDQAKSFNPLELMGFDCQLTAQASEMQLCNDLENLRKALKLELDGWDVYISELQKLADFDGYESTPSLERFEQVMQVHQELSEACASLEIPEILFWQQMLQSTREYLIIFYHFLHAKDALYNNGRDSQMAKNLLWHLEQYPKRRFIVWAANQHIARAVQTITVETGDLVAEGQYMMGSHLHTVLGDQMCSIAVLGYQGEMARYRDINSQQLQPQTDNLESLCTEAGLENALWNLRASPFAGQTMNARFGGEKTRFFADWSQVFDVVLFTKNVTRSHSAVPLI